MLIMHYGVGRSDDVRQFRIADLAKPAALAVGPCVGFVYTLVLRGGKKDQASESVAKDAAQTLCPIASINILNIHFFVGRQSPTCWLCEEQGPSLVSCQVHGFVFFLQVHKWQP